MHLLRTLPAALAAAGGLACAPARAQTPPPEPPQATVLPPVSISATRTPRASDDVPGSVSVDTAAQAEARGASSFKELLADEPDLAIRTAPARFSAAGSATGRAGSEGLNIRGLEGNQVLMLVDGIRVPNAFSFAAFSTGRGDYLSIDTFRSAEVLRGAASTQYGSDGLAGVLSIRTPTPEDLLGPERSLGGYVRLGYAEADRGTRLGAGVAGRSGAWSWLVVGGGGHSHETETQGGRDVDGSTRTTANPADVDTRSVLAKLAFDAGATQRLTLTAEAHRRDTDTEVLSARRPAAPPFVPFPTVDLDTSDRVERARVSLEHRWRDPARGVEELVTLLYGQRAEVRQFSDEDRGGAPFDRTRDNRYRHNGVGLTTQATGRIAATDALPFAQRWSAGFDLARQSIRGVRDGTLPPAGETFPVKPFPDTRYTLAGMFVQDEIETGQWSVIPALRYDRYKLAPSADGYAGGAVATLSDSAFTPRLGVIWRAAPAFAPYAQVAKGFRAPTPDQVNNGFSNPAGQPKPYRSIGNPDLKPERARSVELGLRGAAAGWRWQAAAYDNRYKDFIDQVSDDGGATTIFQYVNLAQARIRGWELRAQWQPSAALTLRGAVAAARGTRTEEGVELPLNSVEPLRAFVGAEWKTGPWALRADLRGARGKEQGRIDSSSSIEQGAGPLAASRGYAVLDLGASWTIAPNLTLVANLNNVFDRSYAPWSDLRGLTQNDAANLGVYDAYTAPGRNAQVSVRLDF